MSEAAKSRTEKFLLDVNALLAGIWGHHLRHTDAFAWLEGKAIVLCPLAELGFLRISSNKRAINVTMDKARESLEKFSTDRKVERIFDDSSANRNPFAPAAAARCPRRIPRIDSIIQI